MSFNPKAPKSRNTHPTPKTIRAVVGQMVKLVAHWIEKIVEWSWAWFREVMGWRYPAVVIPYISYGNGNKVRLIGRVLEDYKHSAFIEGTGRFKHLIKVIRLFITYDVPGAKLKAKFRGHEFYLTTDEEGYFSEVFELDPESQSHNSSCEVEYEILEVTHGVLLNKKLQFESQVIFPNESTDYIVISDIDDTILKSHATNIFRLVANTLFFPFEKRETFFNTVNFYQRLKKGKSGDRNNLFFYVSSSSWNIYGLLRAFIENQKFPLGVMLLQDLGSDKERILTTGHEHKLHRIREIATLNKDLPLVLIGDAGQRDPYLYLEALKSFPDRVKIIFIRKIAWGIQIAHFDELVREAKALGVDMVFFEDPAELEDLINALLP